MCNPPLDDLAQRGKAAPACGKIERKIELIAALPVVHCVDLIKYVDFCRGRQPKHRYQWREGFVAETRDRLFVGCKQRTVMQSHLLGSEEKLGRAQREGTLAIVESVAQNHVHDLVEKDMRHLDGVPDDGEIGPLDRPMRRKQVAEGEHHLPVLARVGIGNRRDLGGRHRTARVNEQAGMQGFLTCASLRRRR